MIKARARWSWLPIAALAGVLAAVLAFLYVRTQGYDATRYHEDVALLRQLKQLDARWELDVLRARMGIEPSYDSLVDPLVSLNELWDRLQTVVTSQRDWNRGAIANAADAYHQAVQKKTRLIEHFKSHNSVLRNSQAFLPTAADDVQKAIARIQGNDRSALAPVATGVNRALLDSMVYVQTPSDDEAADIQNDLTLLAGTTGDRPLAVSAALEIFTAHVHTVLREQPEVRSLLNNISAVPIAVNLDELDNLLANSQRQAELQAQRYRRGLFVFAAALATLLMYVAVKLIHSHAVINRVNHELAAANESLELRVQERTRELQETQSELLRTARQAGMAEIATNVLHNVGNVLNSVNVSAGLIQTRIRESKADGFARAVQLMNDHAADLGEFLTCDEKGKRLPGYLNNLAATLATERSVLIEELQSLTKGVDHIRDIVATQQSYAGAVCLTEPVQVSDLVDDALRMNAGALTHRQVAVSKSCPDGLHALLDKHLMLQILVNLIANALQAMDAVKDRPHRLALRVETADRDGGRRLRIHVEDNGEGIAAEHLPRLFAHGFTTRKNGHGFGLHSCALAARSMDGQLTVHSFGPGAGATFVLDLLFKEPASMT